MKAVINSDNWKKIRQYLDSEKERIAFVYVRKSRENELVDDDILLLKEEDYKSRSSWGVELKDYVRPKIIKHALSKSFGIIEVHAHWGQAEEVDFSPVDEQGLSEIAPHMLWRLNGMPYGAIVISRRHYEGMIWSVSQTSKLELTIDGGETDR